MDFSLTQLILYFLKLGATGFGGPIALMGYMEEDLVEKKRWFSRKQYLHAMALAQIVPGPVAQQMAIYFGWLKGRIFGATAVAVVFLLPSFLIVWILSFFYEKYQGLSWMNAVLYGMGAAVVGVILHACVKLTKISLEKRKGLWLIFVMMALTTASSEKGNFLYFIAAGVIAVLIYAFPKGRFFTLPPVELFLFFAKAALVVYGSGMAIIPFIYHDVVYEYHWLTDQQFVDAVTVGMITPGPVMILAGFIGYLAAHLPGAIAAVVGIFIPVYLFVILFAPLFHRLIRNAQVQAFVEGVTAAAVGSIAGAAYILGLKAIIDWPTALIALATLGLTSKTKIPTPLLLLGAGLFGIGIKMLSTL